MEVGVKPVPEDDQELGPEHEIARYDVVEGKAPQVKDKAIIHAEDGQTIGA